MSNFEEIRDIMYQTPDEGLWNRLVRTLRAWTGEDPLDVTLTYCRDHMAAWPKDLPTFAPPGWLQRPLADIENDPLLDFLVFAARDRTDHFLTKARVEVDKGRASKMPSWLNIGGLGPMRWRDGEALNTKQRELLLSKMKSKFAKTTDDANMQRLRHYLNDADCQQWGKQIHDDWIAAGSESSQKWGLFQVAVFGQTSQIPCDASTYQRLLTRNRSARVKQYIGIVGKAQTEEAYKRLTQTMLRLPIHLKTRYHVTAALNTAAEAQDMPLLPFLKTQGGLWTRFDRAEAEFIASLDGKKGLNEAQRKTLIEMLEDMLLCQREWTFRQLRDTLLSTPALADSLQPLIWHTDADHTFRWTSSGAVDAKGGPYDISDEAAISLCHPVQLEATQLDAWRTHLEEAGLTQCFPQIERPFWRPDSPVMTEAVPVGDPYFFNKLSHWHHGEEQSGGYAHSLVKVLPQPLWYIEASLNYGLSTFDLGPVSWAEEPDSIVSFKLRCKLGNTVDWSKDAVAYSEASAAVAELMAVAEASFEEAES